MEPFSHKTHKYQYVAYDKKLWVVVFHHNILKSSPFVNEKEARFTLDPNKYSILDEINDDHKFNGTHFEFLLYYKEYDIKIRWIQQNNPLDEKEVSGVTIYPGFKLLEPRTGIDLSFFGGLVCTLPEPGKEPPSLLNGYTGSSVWYLAIGMYNHDNDYVKNNTIPGIYSSDNTVGYKTVHEVTLLLRIHNILVIRDHSVCFSAKIQFWDFFLFITIIK